MPARNRRCAAALEDGEARNRTGDTTIFRQSQAGRCGAENCIRMRSTEGPALGRYLQMPVDAWGFRTLRASGVQNPRHDAGRNRRPAVAAPLLRTATRPCPRTLARGLTAATATPSRRAGPSALAQRTPPPQRRAWGRGLLARRSSLQEPLARLPAPPADPNEWLTQSRPARRHRRNGESIPYRGARHRDKSGRQRWFSTRPLKKSDAFVDRTEPSRC
jgi:hypothetical protein